MNTQTSIIVADDDRSVRLVITQALSRQGYHVQPASTAASMWDLVSAGKGQILITDVGFPDGDALDMLPRLQSKRPDLKIIVMSARANLLTAVQAQQQHAFDYMAKPFELAALLDVTKRATLETQKSEAAASQPATNIHLPEEVALPLIGRSASMQTSFKLLARFSAQNIPILILAEPGSGKEEVARTIHEMGASGQSVSSAAGHPIGVVNTQDTKGPFISVQLSKLPPETHEEQLFSKQGSFAQSDNGTIFLNDINLLHPEAQMRLARVLESPTLLAGQPTRLICGSQVDLKYLIEQGQFRDDLYFILSAALLRLPPLRERLEDVPHLVTAITSSLTREFGQVRDVDSTAIPTLQSHNWPRNVSELRFLLRRLFVKSTGNIISVAEVEAELAGLNSVEVESTGDSLGSAAAHHIERYFTALGADLPPPGLHERILNEVERPLIYTTMVRTKGNQIKAAEILGLNRNTLRKKMKLLNLSNNRADYRK